MTRFSSNACTWIVEMRDPQGGWVAIGDSRLLLYEDGTAKEDGLSTLCQLIEARADAWNAVRTLLVAITTERATGKLPPLTRWPSPRSSWAHGVARQRSRSSSHLACVGHADATHANPSTLPWPCHRNAHDLLRAIAVVQSCAGLPRVLLHAPPYSLPSTHHERLHAHTTAMRLAPPGVHNTRVLLQWV